MKRNKLLRVLSLLLTAMLTFTACSGEGKTGESASGTEGESASQTSETPDEEEEGKPSTWIGDVTLRLVRADNPNQPMSVDNLIVDEIKKRTGITLIVEAIPGADFAEKQKTMLATNNMPDILYDTYDVQNFAPSGIFAPISDYLDIMPYFKALLEENPDFKKLYMNDKLYYIPVMSRYTNRMGRLPMIRQDLLAETGMDAPSTFDELYDVLAAIKEKHPDTWPMANRNGTGNLFTCFAYSMNSGYGIYYDPDVEGGKYLYGQIHEEFVPVVAYMNRLYEGGILDPDYAILSSAQWQEKLASGRSSFFFDNPSFALNFNIALQAEDENAAFGPIEIPYTESGTRRGLFYEKHDRGATTIAANSPNVEAAIKLMDFLYSDEGADLTNYGAEGIQYDRTGGEMVLKQEIVDRFNQDTDPVRSFYGSFGGGKLGLARYIDESVESVFTSEETRNMYATWGGWDFMGEPAINPPLTDEENEIVVEINTRINTIWESEIDQFIMGNQPMSEFPALQQKLIDAGAEQLEEIYNTALDRVK